MKTLVLVDGENFKGKIKQIFKNLGKERPHWHYYDFLGLFKTVLPEILPSEITFYFAKIKEHPDSKEKSKSIIQDQRMLVTHLKNNNFQVILTGRVRGHYEENHKKEVTLVFKEKGVDVKIAVDMISIACDKKADKIILVSSDSDLQPAIAEIKSRDIECVYVGFETQPNKGLSYTTNKTILIRDSEIIKFSDMQQELAFKVSLDDDAKKKIGLHKEKE